MSLVIVFPMMFLISVMSVISMMSVISKNVHGFNNVLVDCDVLDVGDFRIASLYSQLN